MTARPIERHGDPRVPRIEKRIGAIAAALPAERREVFLQQVQAAELGQPILDVMQRGWAEAMLAQVPGHEEHLRQALLGVDLRPLPDLVEAEVQ
jgi:hypothetical protein